MSTGRIGRGVGGAGIAAAAVAVATAAAPVLAASQSQAANQTDWGRIGRGAARVAGGVALGVGAVAVAILAPPVLAAGGLSALAGGGMLVGSGVAATYGFGQFSEGVNDISLGIHGFDDSVPAQNLIRDSFFGGDQQASDQLLLYSMTFMSASELIFGLPAILSNTRITRQNHLFRYWPSFNPHALSPGSDGVVALNPPLISSREYPFAIPVIVGPAYSFPMTESLEYIVANMMADRAGGSGTGGGGGGTQGAGSPPGMDSESTETTRVGRWMREAEYRKMVETNQVQMSGDNKVHVANPADINAYSRQAPMGSIYVEFDVPSNTISQGGADGWGIINGPGSLQDRLYALKGLPRITEMPMATNIEIVGSK